MAFFSIHTQAELIQTESIPSLVRTVLSHLKYKNLREPGALQVIRLSIFEAQLVHTEVILTLPESALVLFEFTDILCL